MRASEFAQGDEFARRGEAESDAAGEALEVLNAARSLRISPRDTVCDEIRDGVEAGFDFVAVDGRAENPGTEQTRAHAGDGGIESGDECRGLADLSSVKMGERSSRLRTETGSRTSASCCS